MEPKCNQEGIDNMLQMNLGNATGLVGWRNCKDQLLERMCKGPGHLQSSQMARGPTVQEGRIS